MGSGKQITLEALRLPGNCICFRVRTQTRIGMDFGDSGYQRSEFSYRGKRLISQSHPLLDRGADTLYVRGEHKSLNGLWIVADKVSWVWIKTLVRYYNHRFWKGPEIKAEIVYRGLEDKSAEAMTLLRKALEWCRAATGHVRGSWMDDAASLLGLSPGHSVLKKARAGRVREIALLEKRPVALSYEAVKPAGAGWFVTTVDGAAKFGPFATEAAALEFVAANDLPQQDA